MEQEEVVLMFGTKSFQEQKTFGANIKEQRSRQGITQKQLAEHLYVSQQAVQQWESNKIVPQADKLADIAEVFDCSLLDIYPYSDNLNDNHVIAIDYTSEWNKTIETLHHLPVTSDLEQFIKCSAIKYAESKENTVYRLRLSEREYDGYKFWIQNTLLSKAPSNTENLMFWKFFFPNDFFRTTSAWIPLMAGKTEAVMVGLANFGELLISRNDILHPDYSPEPSKNK